MFVLCAAESDVQAGEHAVNAAMRTSGKPCYAYFNLQAIDRAYRQCRKGKQNTIGACLYQTQLLDHLVTTRDSLQALCWQPKPPISFVVTKPKAREVYAAQFEDRVVHHLLVNELTGLLDAQFIFDAASNRKNKGTHFAVNRLQYFMQQLDGRGWFLQLDIANFFNSVSRPILLNLLNKHLTKQIKKNNLTTEKSRHLYWLCLQIIGQKVEVECAIKLGGENEFANVPAHKRLSNAPLDTGLPIGNLTSQFFANIYMNELDQFIKHHLKCRHYVRYVDDFILCHQSKAQLQKWQMEIEKFLEQKLALSLKEEKILAPLTQGANFLGYIIKPYYRLVRKRVLGNLHEKLKQSQRRLKPSLHQWDFQPELVQNLQAVVNSYWGHFKHADSYQLKQTLFKRYAWLNLLFSCPQQLCPAWYPPNVRSFASQWYYFKQRFPTFVLLMQCGNQIVIERRHEKAMSCTFNIYKHPRLTNLIQIPISQLTQACHALAQGNLAYLFCDEQGHLKNGLKKRCLRVLFNPNVNANDLPTGPLNE
ncbi:reverse transcriptase domain-containing protein [Vibrio gallaecicus]|uniref:RNA-directed DNA polymerase n=1 Tax=Vibrio gallaecicus TaxID=552386 RepID=UPI00358DA616